ncbi:MAG: leucine-rich repeat domain-containing protein, partial [Anaeroplasmataceae bacterium]|nr:leucine-rich repeat domain-containing protein [Anaeroplasmataceae bacterium]
QEYKVRISNKSAKEVVIPSTYEGLPVTAIDDSGFMGCTSLEKVLIPSSIKTIGNSAFMRCTKLKKVLGMSGVEQYGNNAFAMCSNVEYLILPSGIKEMGTTMLRNVKAVVYSRTSEESMEELNSTWTSSFQGQVVYGNDLVYEEYTNAEGETGVSLVPYQNLHTEPKEYDPNTTLIIECMHRGQKVLNIGTFALADCNAQNIIIKYPEETDEKYNVNIESYAFMDCLAENISVEVNITANDFENTDDGKSAAIFYGCQAKSITLPDSLDYIPYQAFMDCSLLEEVKIGDNELNHLSKSIKRIEASAFYGCTSLPELFIEDTIEFIGQAAFYNWGSYSDIEQHIYINLLQADDNWSIDWNQKVSENVIEFIAATEFNVKLVVEQAGVLDTIGSTEIKVNRNSTLNDLVLPTISSASHNFTGKWYIDEERTQEYTPD